MAYTYTRAGVTFIAGETAPSAREALSGTPVVNHLGNTALEGFSVNQLNGASEVTLDLTDIPAALHLRDALTTARFGHIDESTGEFVEFDNEASRSERGVSGTYTGPGSELFLV